MNADANIGGNGMRLTINGREVSEQKDPGGLWGKFQQMFPNLANTLFVGDQFLSSIIFNDTDEHTISWHIACLEQGGHTLAMIACEVLSAVLSPNHCASAIAMEGPCP